MIKETDIRKLVDDIHSAEEAHKNGIASDAFYQIGVEDVIAMIRKRPGIVLVFETVSTQYDISRYQMLEPLIAAIKERRTEGEASRSRN